MWLKVCLNGSRSRADHPAVPIRPWELAAAAVESVAAGAGGVHVHPRDAHARESLAADDIAAAVRAVRAACPGIPLGVSTGLWITGGDTTARQSAVIDWVDLPDGDRPDFASVNVGEPGHVELATLLLDMGIAVEAGVHSPADVDVLDAAGLGSRWTRLLVEIIGGTADEAPSRAEAILRGLDRIGLPQPQLLHGEDDGTWPMIAMAARLGLDTRIGLEDVTQGPDGRPVGGNADLVRLALAQVGAPSPADSDPTA